MSGGHNVRVTSWVTVVLVVIGVILLGLALPMQSVVLGIIGGVLVLVGVVFGGVTRIMDDAY